MSIKTQFFHVNRLEDLYQIICEIGRGTYGKVYKCREYKTNSIQALKRINVLKPNDGFPLNTIREINLLQNLHHDCIIGLRSIITVSPDANDKTMTNRVFLAFDYCEFDLYGLMYSPDPNPMTPLHIASYTRQLLMALVVCSTNSIVHRDLKPANLFVTRNNVLKVGDFGLARKLIEGHPRYTNNVITLFYRAPELLLGCQSYRYEVDIWSVGCIIYEMITRRTLFKCPKGNESGQIKAIFDICGTPNIDEWPSLSESIKDTYFKNPIESSLHKFLEFNIPQEYKGAIDLIEKMLNLSPHKRINAEIAIKHEYLLQYGNKIEPSNIPPLQIEEVHQMQAAEFKKSLSVFEKVDHTRPQV